MDRNIQWVDENLKDIETWLDQWFHEKEIFENFTKSKQCSIACAPGDSLNFVF
jgi:hypothetical protein